MNTKQRARIVLPIALVLLVAATWLIARSRADGNGILASGTIEATEADLGFQRPGRITAITVREGDSVVAGDTIAQLYRGELEASYLAAEAGVDAAQARLQELLSGSRSEEVAQTEAAERAAAQRFANARRDVERTRRLLEGGAVSQELLDHHQTAFEVARADHEQVQERLRLVRAGPRPEQITAQRAAVRLAEAQREQIDAALEQMEITAPFGGQVSARHREIGEIVPAGAPVLRIMDPGNRWVRIYVREDIVGRLGIGQTMTISADAYPDRQYRGQIVFIAAQAEFTPRNVQTTEERVKLVHEVRVRITADSDFDLKPGLAADVRLYEGQ